MKGRSRAHHALLLRLRPSGQESRSSAGQRALKKAGGQSGAGVISRKRRPRHHRLHRAPDAITRQVRQSRGHPQGSWHQHSRRPSVMRGPGAFDEKGQRNPGASAPYAADQKGGAYATIWHFDPPRSEVLYPLTGITGEEVGEPAWRRRRLARGSIWHANQCGSGTSGDQLCPG